MAFKHKIDKETFDSLTEAVQKEYEEKSGEYFLQVEGMVPKARVDEFRDNNIELKKRISTLEESVDAFGGMTKSDLDELKRKAEAAGGEIDEEAMNKLLEERLTKRVEKMNLDHKTEVENLTNKLGIKSTAGLVKYALSKGL